MAKNKKFKKSFFTLGLVVALICVNYLSANAGTNRQFWNMSIRSYQGDSVLTTRYKETALQYSMLDVTSMTSVGKVYTQFVGSTYGISNNVIISNGVNTGVWIKVPNTATTTWAGAPIALSNHNYNWNSTTGTLGGWVDYE